MSQVWGKYCIVKQSGDNVKLAPLNFYCLFSTTNITVKLNGLGLNLSPEITYPGNCFMVPFSLSRQILRYYIKMGYDCLLPFPSQFIIHAIILTCYATLEFKRHD